MMNTGMIKSPNDANEYKYLELPNKLKVMLVSDGKADVSAAGMSVAVGSFDDPPHL
jgi:insulysin